MTEPEQTIMTDLSEDILDSDHFIAKLFVLFYKNFMMTDDLSRNIYRLVTFQKCFWSISWLQ